MTTEDGLFAKAVQGVIDMGEDCIIVHGGGPHIDSALKEANIAPAFLGGYRVTTPQVFEIVQRVLTGVVLRNVVAQLRGAGINAVGICGRDGGVLVAKKLAELVDGSPVDLGQVGEIVKVDRSLLDSLISAGFLPVVSSIAVEGDETTENSQMGLNVNADLAAGEIAGAVRASTLIFMTDVAGIYRNWPDISTLISSISASELRTLKGSFADGMAPKVLACLNAIDAGAQSVRIIDGKDPQAFALALRGIGGTVVTP